MRAFPELPTGFSIDWLQTAGFIVSAATGIATYRMSDDFKKQEAVNKLMEPYKLKLTANEKFVTRSIVTDFKTRIALWGRGGTRATTVIAGLYQAGKTWAMDRALEGLSGVLAITLEDDKLMDEILRKLGVKAEMFEDVLSETAKKLVEQNAINPLPTIILDIPRTSKVDIKTVSSFCKRVATDDGLAHVIVLASSASFAMGFDAGGEARRYDIWVPDLTVGEANELFRMYNNIQESDKQEVMKKIGLNVGRLRIAADKLANGEHITDAINDNFKLRDVEVRNLLAVCVKEGTANDCKVGREIAEALLDSMADTVDHETWGSNGILPKEVAQLIKDRDAYAIFFHTTELVWKFASPAHRLAASRRLRPAL